MNESSTSYPITGRFRSTAEHSTLTILTTKREDFDPYVYVCTARGARTTQEHVIRVIQLCEYTEG